MRKTILVTGGAGFVGSRLVPFLLERGYKVKVLDNLMYNQSSLLNYLLEENFEFIKGDITDELKVKKSLENVDFIIHLAAIVGAPRCEKDPELAIKVNLNGAEVINRLRENIPIIFPSTGSVYGKLTEICTENSPVNPLSIYGKTKYEAEEIIKKSENYIIFRPATAFGVSQRMRTDLLINDFVYQALKLKYLTIFEGDAKRTFIHVSDFAKAIIYAIENFNHLKNDIYNLGNETLNYTKEEIAKKIAEITNCTIIKSEFGTDPDQRDYEVSYEKLRKKGFSTSILIEEGIKELIKAKDMIQIKNPYSNQE